MSLPPLPPHLDPRGHHRARRTGGAGAVARPIGRGLAALLSVALLLVSGYYWLTFRNLDNGLARLPGLHVGIAAPTPSGSAATDEPALIGKAQNILVVGNDDRSNMTRKEQLDLHVGSGQGSNSTDTMMIVHIPADGSKATLISLPRDSYVDIPGYGMDKLNAAFVDGYNNTIGSRKAKITAGANKLIDVVIDLTGVTIDHYVQIGLLGFYRIANALNGVPIDLCASQDDSYSGFDMAKGMHTLNGKESLEFVRQRHGLTSDLDRVKRQQYFLTSAFRQVASAGILVRLKSLGNALKESMFFDGNFNILDLAKQIEHLTADNINGATIPTTPDMVGSISILRVDPVEVRRYVKKLLSKAAPSTSTPPSTSSSSTAPSPTKSPNAIDSKCVN